MPFHASSVLSISTGTFLAYRLAHFFTITGHNPHKTTLLFFIGTDIPLHGRGILHRHQHRPFSKFDRLFIRFLHADNNIIRSPEPQQHIIHLQFAWLLCENWTSTMMKGVGCCQSAHKGRCQNVLRNEWVYGFMGWDMCRIGVLRKIKK